MCFYPHRTLPPSPSSFSFLYHLYQHRSGDSQLLLLFRRSSSQILPPRSFNYQRIRSLLHPLLELKNPNSSSSTACRVASFVLLVASFVRSSEQEKEAWKEDRHF